MKKQISLIAALIIATTASAINDTVMNTSDESNAITINTEDTVSSLPRNTISDQSEDTSSSSPSILKWKKNYINVYYTAGGSLDIKLDASIFSGFNGNEGKYSVNGSFGMSVGHTFFIGGNDSNKFRFGVDAEWFDLNYAHYKYDHNTDDKEATYGKVDISTGFGPSVTYQPVNGLYLKAYAHVLPTLMLTAGNEYDKTKGFTDQWSSFNGTFQAVVNTGVNVAYKFIGFGVEYRYCSLQSVSIFGVTDGSANSCRAYVQLCF